MSEAWDISYMELPCENVTAGVAFDIGGSVGKAVLVTKQHNGILSLMLIRFNVADQLAHVLDYIRRNDFLKKDQRLYCTGAQFAGAAQKLIQAQLDPNAEILFEFDSSVRCALYLVKQGVMGDWLLPNDTQYEQECINMYAKFYGHLQLHDPILPDWFKPFSPKFPFYMLYIGSGMQFCKVYEDWHFEPLYGSGSGGKQVQALGMNLTGAKDHNEWMSLVAAGDAMKVDQSTVGMTAEQADDEDIYSVYKQFPEVNLFPMGKTIKYPNESYAKEDIARSLLIAELSRIVLTVTQVAPYEKFDHVFVYGGFVDSELVRTEMTKVFARHAMLHKYYYKKDTCVRPYYLKQSAFLPCIGNLLAAVHKEPVSMTKGWLPF